MGCSNKLEEFAKKPVGCSSKFEELVKKPFFVAVAVKGEVAVKKPLFTSDCN